MALTFTAPTPTDVEYIFFRGDSTSFAAWDICTQESKPPLLGKSI